MSSITSGLKNYDIVTTNEKLPKTKFLHRVKITHVSNKIPDQKCTIPSHDYINRRTIPCAKPRDIGTKTDSRQSDLVRTSDKHNRSFN